MIFTYQIWPNFFSKEICNDIIEHTKNSHSLSDGVIGSDDISLKEQEEIRRSQIAFIDNNDLKQSIYDCACLVNRDHFGFNLSDNYVHNDLQFTEYSEKSKGKYDYHMDMYAGGGSPYYDRKMSVVIQLSDTDSYEGGDFYIKLGTNAFTEPKFRDQGTAIFFPSFLLHKITEVTKGTRNSLVTWLNGPSWK